MSGVQEKNLDIEQGTPAIANQANLTEGGNTAFHNYINDFAHIDDPLERRRLALEKIDETSFGWLQIRTILVAGVGFMTDSYDIFAINIGIAMLSYVFWEGNMPASTTTLLKVSTSVGTVIGQIGFGCAADILGRKKIYGTELIVVIVTCILQCSIGTSPGVNFVAVLTFYRIIMGIGIGGDYPLSSIITSEFSTTKWRGAIMGAVFANQAWGQIAGAIIALITVAAYKDDLKHANSGAECDARCQKACDQMWRILVGFGAVPGVLALYYRLTIPESPRYQLDINTDHSEVQRVTINNDTKLDHIDSSDAHSENLAASIYHDEERMIEQMYGDDAAAPPKASFKDFCRHFGQWKYGKILLGTAGTWFMLDVAFYGLSLNSAVILQTIGYAGSSNVYQKLYDSCVGNLILICAGSLPGYWCSVFTIDTIGRKPVQIMGFVMLTALFCIIGFAYDKLTDHGLLVCYVFCQFFCNFGPNVTTFIIPGEIFPTRYRSSAHGISAASGKIGAIIAQTALGTLIDHNCARDGKKKNCWLPHVMEIFALFMLVGLLLCFLVPETKRMTLEEIAEKYHDEVDPSKVNRQRLESESEEASNSQ
ncbi:similar to Saccharomyces cerevisiae YML123C PHO84 High-affinity inorganic phosphate (Pi) transporter and low-affinity manganese transporter [Maudiozyma saulgeensis]|uniref:Similar to Saccharomyces cerevisiae YML123C PHO84 High-affinity inorganic phosphate (Pi) transporter and low-affinity manganese transporter n=1 Tax=Maudiozyma saulgeensis TaxID=1789683 RepID=A0A1X7R4X6_9SACH|nr:similar to Saccharomyces cerevisiae YML123C PHO84 High-affinity inorganic phosphate (Pi) transporter and low-affinity manganese transporter [Kazachstania saulgeensis]